MARLFFVLSVVLGLGLTACQPSPESFQPTTAAGSSDKLFSNKPQTSMVDIAVIKLPSKALMAGAQNPASKKEVDQQLLATITAEQDELIAKLQEISPQIEVVFRYKWLINGVSFVLPPAFRDEVGKVAGMVGGELVAESYFDRPADVGPGFPVEQKSIPFSLDINEKTTVQFIGADKVHEKMGITGAGIKVGIIDTGIDYTHAALGGEGTPAAYAAIDPDLPTDAFPNQKVVGGYDFVGSSFGADSLIPKPDVNPLDEAGHGTHVAATVGGIGDDSNVYAGVAPDSELYALKVFGTGGGTGDVAVIAAMEFAVDPNGDLMRDDQLDVVNLSLGSDYGQPHTLYQEAIDNLIRAGTFVVAAAGNSGHVPYIVGSPSTADSALSVAASIDDLPHNIEFATVAFTTPSFGEVVAEATEGPISQPIAESDDSANGSLVYIGLAKNITSEQKKALLGKVALIDRGEIPFFEKLTNAKEAGAVGAVVVNNVPGEPAIAMGGEPDQKVDIPAVMVSFEVGTTLKAELENGVVTIRFKNDEKILKPELVDTLTTFSSIGPRSEDSLLKPEITAPGSQVISAKMGSGTEGIMFSGTSMAAPHVTGVIALLKQIHPEMETQDLKSLVMSTAKTLSDVNGDVYPVSMQGAGRVQAFQAAEQLLVLSKPSLSLGVIDVQSKMTFSEQIAITNLSSVPQELVVDSELSEGLKVNLTSGLTLAPGETRELELEFTVDPRKIEDYYKMAQGFVVFLAPDRSTLLAKVPVLGVLNRISDISVTGSRVGDEEKVEFDLNNASPNPGPAFMFNLISNDARKERSESVNELYKSVACDLQSAGYRIVDKVNAEGETVQVLQVAAQLYDSVTIWKLCEISVQFDSDGDGEADQELGGIHSANLGTLGGDSYQSVLLDAPMAKTIRARYEFSMVFGTPQPEDYLPAIQAIGEMVHFDHSTLAILEAPMEALKKNADGQFSIKVATLHLTSQTVEPDDFLGPHAEKWTQIAATPEQSGYYSMPTSNLLQGGETQTLNLKKGAGSEQAVFYYPGNARNPEQQSTVVQ